MNTLIDAAGGVIESGLAWFVLGCSAIGAVLALALLEPEIRSAFRYVRRVGVKRIVWTAITRIVGLKNSFSFRTMVAGIVYLSPTIVLIWVTTATNNRAFAWFAMAILVAGTAPLFTLLNRWVKKLHNSNQS